MANVYHERRWIIDTPGPDMITLNSLYVKQVIWTGANLDALIDKAVITDANDGILYDATALGTHIEGVRSVENWWWDGFKVPTLGGGVLEIWHT